MSQNDRVRQAVAAVLLTQVAPVAAGVVEFDDKQAWFGAVGSVTTIDFTGFPGGTYVTDQYADLGVLFTDGFDVISCCGTTWPNDGAGLLGGSSVSLSFTTPQSWIALDYRGAMISLFSAGELLHVGQFPGSFAGLISSQTFDAVLIEGPPDGNVTFDDLYFGVPAPGAAWLLAALLLAPTRRRRRPPGTARIRARDRPGLRAAAVAAAAAATLGPAAASLAGVVEYTDRQAWFDAVDQVVTTIGFTGIDCGTDITDQYQDLGLLFPDGNDHIVCCTPSLCPNDLAGLAGTLDGISVVFSTPKPQTVIAVDFVNDVVISLFAAGELIYASSHFGELGGGNFAGLISIEPFDAALISNPLGAIAFIDDLYYVAGAMACPAVAACEADKVVAPDAFTHDFLGSAVAGWGDVMVAGAPGVDSIVGFNTGAAYVYRSADGIVWPFEQQLQVFDGQELDEFGRAVAVAGDFVAVGAPYHDEAGTNAGAVYVYRHIKGQWFLDAKLLAPDADLYDDLGWALAMDPGPPTRIVASAAFDNDNGFDSGSIYVFRFDEGTGWTLEQKLLANDGGAHDNLGISVAIDAGPPLRIVAGAYNDDDNGFDAGAAYVFRSDDTNALWQQEAKLLADDGQPEDQLGFSVAISGDAAIVGAPWDDDNGDRSGSAYVFRHDEETSSWQQEQKLLPDFADMEDQFGISVALHGQTAIVGAWLDDDNGTIAGAVYRFVPSENGWTQEEEVFASDGAVGDVFGRSVAMWRHGGAVRFAVGAPWEEPNNPLAFAGAAYVFNLAPAGDLDCDGLATVGDLLAVLSSWGSCAIQEDCPPDLNCDGTVGVADLLMLLGNWSY